MGFCGLQGGVNLTENLVIIEIKYRRETPVLFKRLIDEFSLNLQAVSKYRMAAVELGLARAAETPKTYGPEVSPKLCLTS